MPPKRNTRTAPAAAAAVAGRGETPTPNATAAARAAQRRAREEPAEEQRFLRPRLEFVQQFNSSWSYSVRTILLHQFDRDVGKMRLMEFVQEHLNEDLPPGVRNPLMDTVITNPNGYIPEELREAIEGLEAFQLLRDAHQASKDAVLLNKRGIVSLRQWKSTVDRDALNISAYAKGILDDAISEAEQTDNLLRQQEEIRQLKEKLEKLERSPQGNVTVLDGVYESIYDAKWDYVVKSLNGVAARFWLEVKEDNVPPSLEWTDEEVDYFKRNVNKATITRIRAAREEELKEDANNVKPTRERLQMKVLTSTQGWPYKDSGEIKILDCYITKEVERAWRFIHDDLYEWFDDPSRSEKKPRKRILTGTPGIGKSMAAGSYLLYKLLHYNVEQLPVVVYFIGSKAYIFDKKKTQVTMCYAEKGLREAEELAQECNGYTIYDCSGKAGEAPLDLPDTWGTTVITSPNETNFKRWEKYRGSTNIVVNCPTTVDLKAMHVWKQRNNNNNRKILSDWAVIAERAKDLGPLPRFVFNGMTSQPRKKTVEKEIRNITSKNSDLYVGVSSEVWDTKNPCHKLAMIFRESTDISYRMDFYGNAPLSGRIKGKIIERLAKLLECDEFLETALFNANHAAWVALETYACGAFRNKEFVRKARGEIKRLKKETTDDDRKCILQENLEARPSKDPTAAYSTETLGSPKIKMTLEFKKLYIPESETFPLVDAFFFARPRDRKTIVVGLQTTTAGRHPTKTSTVRQFMDYLSNFDKWVKHSKDLVMEIIYVQCQGAKPIKKWQECSKVGEGSSAPQFEEAKKFWDERVFQYHLCLSAKLK